MEFWTSTLWKYEFINGKLVPVPLRTFTKPAKDTEKYKKKLVVQKKGEYQPPVIVGREGEEVDF